MINCTAQVFKDTDVLDHGHRASETTTPLWAGPAYVAAPSRSWEREAALEGVIAGGLHVHTTVNLQPATRVTIANHASAGEYQVLTAACTGSEWRLALQRRPHGGA